MAATLTDAGELTFVSFPIEKTETTDDGDLIVFGKATDGSVDHDEQVVLPSFAGPAISKWLETGGNLRVQHSAQRDPAGIGLEVKHDGDATWVKGLVIEPVAKRLVAAGALRAYSVGIARPTIERDPTGKARGGIISGGEIVEISLVDRPANKRCGIQLVKSADDGTPEYVGKVFGGDDAIAKALGEPEVAKAAAPAASLASDDLSITFTPNDLARLVKSKFVQQHYDELAAQAVTEKRDFDRGVGGGVDRDKLPAADFAGPHRSFPVVSQSDVSDAMHLAGHAADPDQVRANVKRIANREGLSVPDDDNGKNKGTEEVTEPVTEKSGGVLQDAALKALAERNGWTPAQLDAIPADAVPGMLIAAAASAVKEAEPEVTKDPEPEDKPEPVKKAKGKSKGKKKLPPWLNSGSDDEKGSDGDSGSCKSAHIWAISDPATGSVECSKCHTSPAAAAGVTASPMDPAPVGELMESNPPASVKGATPQSAGGVQDSPAMQQVPQHREPDGAGVEPFEKDAGMPATGQGEAPTKLETPSLKYGPEVAALMRFRQAGIDPELGKLHDLTCPAYHPDEVAKFHPFADLAGLIDEGAWARKALDAACGPIQNALAMHDLHGAAMALKAADEADVNDWRLAAYKAFRDANPGPGTYPSPGAISPQRYNRPLLTDGREASSPGHSGPNVSPVVATMAPNAQNFDRPPLSAGQTSPSPSFMKWDSGQYPQQQGVPTQLNYAHLEKDKQRMALVQMHDHLGRQFPEVCPLDSVDLSGRQSRPLRGEQPEHHPVPATAGIGKADGIEARIEAGETILPKSAVASVAASFKADPEAGADFFADADVYKGFKKMRKKLGKRVLAGEMTVDEARAKMGRQFAQKGTTGIEALPLAPADPADAPQVPVPTPLAQKSVTADPATIKAVVDPEIIKSAVHEATYPLLLRIERTDGSVGELRAELASEREAFVQKLAETQRVIDAIADQPDPSTAAFSGVAFQPVRKTARPAGVTDIAEAAARARRATERELENTVNSASDPYVREAARQSLERYQGGGA